MSYTAHEINEGERRVLSGPETAPHHATEQWQNISTLNQSDAGKQAAQNAVDQYFGSLQIFELPASQAVRQMPPLSESVIHGGSPIKLNVQITNVPEVSAAVKPEEALQYLNRAFESGAQGVKPIERWMATPNTVNDALLGAGPALDSAVNYYANTPGDQVAKDARTVIGDIGDALDKTFSFAHKPEQRAKAAGTAMSMFFLDGMKEPLHAEVAQQMGLGAMEDCELAKLGINKIEMQMPEIPEHVRHLELQKATPELLDAIAKKGRTVDIAEAGSEQAQSLQATDAKASYTYTVDGEHIITLPPNAPKIAALEEFLHATQKNLGILDRVEHPVMAEVEVKDFMIRHSRILGLSNNDVKVLEALKLKELQKLERAGYRLKD